MPKPTSDPESHADVSDSTSPFEGQNTRAARPQETASFEKLGTEIWQIIIELIRGVSLSSVFNPAIHWSYPLRVCPQDNMEEGLSVVKRNLANINLSCRFLCMQVRLHRKTFPLAIQWEAETEEDWTRTMARLVDSGNYGTIQGWALRDLRLTQSKIPLIKDLLLRSPPLKYLETAFGMAEKFEPPDGPTASTLGLAMGIVLDRSRETLEIIRWSTSRTDILWKLREIDPPLLELNALFAHIYDEHVVAAANRERRTWNKLRSLQLIYDLFSGGDLSSPIRMLCGDYFPDVQFLELLPGCQERWATCIALLRNCPSLKVLVLNTYLLNRPRPMNLPVLNTVTTVALNCGHIASLGLNFIPNASTIILLSHCIMKDKKVEYRLKALYRAMHYIAEHKPKAMRFVKLKGVGVGTVRAYTWPSIVRQSGLDVFERMNGENITVLDHYGETLLGTDFKVE